MHLTMHLLKSSGFFVHYGITAAIDYVIVVLTCFSIKFYAQGGDRIFFWSGEIFILGNAGHSVTTNLDFGNDI